MSNDKKPEGVCPVDHSSREVWLKSSARPLLEDSQPSDQPSDQPTCPVDHSARSAWLLNGGENPSPDIDNCSSDRLDSSLSSTPSTSVPSLPTDREISSIPRANTNSNWVYPSQQQFYNAMLRKNWSPDATDMKTVVPIHNAVNERAWSQILEWEDNEGGQKCGGTQLVKFQGDSKKITPKAWFNMMVLGYAKPFDRHDWTVDRCGTKVEYVLDFYSGKSNPLAPEMPSFYIDVRPKLNTFEGCRMRLFKFLGLK